MTTQLIPYEDQGVKLEGLAVFPKTGKKAPVVLLCHSWSGRDGYIAKQAEIVAQLGYIGFALDVYGKGVVGKSKEENAALKKPFLQDRTVLQRRLLSGLDVLHTLPTIDLGRIAVMGFGFGGLCALDLARSTSILKGAISLYGHFEPPGYSVNPISAKILLLHGYEDKVVPVTELISFTNDLSKQQVDWQAHLFGNTAHAFTNPQANDPAQGIQYSSTSTTRAWMIIQTFLHELFI